MGKLDEEPKVLNDNAAVLFSQLSLLDKKYHSLFLFSLLIILNFCFYFCYFFNFVTIIIIIVILLLF